MADEVIVEMAKAIVQHTGGDEMPADKRETEEQSLAGYLQGIAEEAGLFNGRGKMALTAEEVQVAYGVLEHVRRSVPGGRTNREAALAGRMKLMLGSSADGERR